MGTCRCGAERVVDGEFGNFFGGCSLLVNSWHLGSLTLMIPIGSLTLKILLKILWKLADNR